MTSFFFELKTLRTVLDIFTIWIALFVAYYIRKNFFSVPLADQISGLPLSIFWFSVVFSFYWLIVFYYTGLYKIERKENFNYEVIKIIKGVSLGLLGIVAWIFLEKLTWASRSIILLFWLLGILFIILERCLLRCLIYYLRKRGVYNKMVLMVDKGERTFDFVRELSHHKEWGLKIIGFVTFTPTDEKEIAGYPVLGSIDDIPDLINRKVVDIVVMSPNWRKPGKMASLIKLCEVYGIDVYFIPEIFDISFAQLKIEKFLDFPLILFYTAPKDYWKLLIKRLIDILGSLTGLILFSPLFLLIAILIKLDSAGPVFFSQKRVGLNGRKFVLYKFRTMEEYAQKQLRKLLPLNETGGPAFKITNDPRVTRVGRFLRKTSLDELPQLWNVLKGDMSLVGPRPSTKREVALYKDWQRRRLSMKPGLTCLWQISGRSDIKFDKWMEMDLEYIDNWSLWLDLKILFKTIPAVLLGRGAK